MDNTVYVYKHMVAGGRIGNSGWKRRFISAKLFSPEPRGYVRHAEYRGSCLICFQDQ